VNRDALRKLHAALLLAADAVLEIDEEETKKATAPRRVPVRAPANDAEPMRRR